MGYFKDGRWVLDSNDEASGYGTAGTSGSGDALPATDAQIESLQRALATQRTINSSVIADAVRRGAAQVLREIAKLPSPLVFNLSGANPRMGEWLPAAGSFGCRWCETEWPYGGDVDLAAEAHPVNGCLFVRALAVVTPQGETDK